MRRTELHEKESKTGLLRLPLRMGLWDRCGFDICMSVFIIWDWFTNIYRRYFVRQPCKMSGRQDKSRLTFPFYHPKAFTNFRILIVSFSLNISKLFNFLIKMHDLWTINDRKNRQIYILNVASIKYELYLFVLNLSIKLIKHKKISFSFLFYRYY